MADNIVIRDGSNVSQTMATDDISGVNYPRHKVTFGVDGAAVDVSSSNPMPVTANYSRGTGGHVSAQTAATGTNWTAFGSQSLKQLTISNQTGVTLEFRQGGSGVGFQIPSGAFYTFFGITNANQIDVRRVDTSNTQVTVQARWES